MLRRKVEATLEKWLESKYALLVDGAVNYYPDYMIEFLSARNSDNYWL